MFLKARSPEFSANRSSRIHSSHSKRSALDSSASRTPILSPPRLNRVPSLDQSNSGAPFEDLRRRLASINGSASSLSPNHPSSHSPRGALPMSPGVGSTSTPSPLTMASLPQTTGRPGSPTDSVVSTANSLTFRPLSRLQVGSTDGQKVAPLIGSSRANATGVLEAHSKLRSEGSPERSGRSSPMSMSQTIRNVPRPRLPSLLPISTYGM